MIINLLLLGIWSYHAKLYHDSVFPDTKMTVDVVTKSHSSAGIGVTITASHTAMQVSTNDYTSFGLAKVSSKYRCWGRYTLSD